VRTLLCLLFFPALISFHPVEPLRIETGVQADGLILGKHKVSSATMKYGTHTKLSQGIACGWEHDYHYNRFSFSTGVTVLSTTIDNEDRQSSVIDKIGISWPTDAETTEGIRLTCDDSDRIIAVYGLPESTDTARTTVDIHYASKGISFRCERSSKRIKIIEIYIPGHSADFWF
jgi:hypothetical protein